MSRTTETDTPHRINKERNAYYCNNMNSNMIVVNCLFSHDAFEFGEIPNISKHAEQAGKLGKKLEWKIWIIVF